MKGGLNDEIVLELNNEDIDSAEEEISNKIEEKEIPEPEISPTLLANIGEIVSDLSNWLILIGLILLTIIILFLVKKYQKRNSINK